MNTVEIRNASKHYGKNNEKFAVLNGLDMTVKQGSIFALLGSSGCGKTTLLSCIIGSMALNSGSIKVLRKNGSRLPGHKIGYMPQQIALIEEFTIKEVIYYFGRIYGMKDGKIKDQFNFLKKLLDLPPASRLVSDCSGGQQRRVSFAVAILHDPDLLILDEPTVGLDPVLRSEIWDFLIERTKSSNLAVIITTHYIEEAKNANCIGLMRNGTLLAEDSPRNIITRFQVESLEEAFLQLSLKQESNLDAIASGRNMDIIENNQNNIEVITNMQPDLVEKKDENNYARKMKALLNKNLVQLIRQRLGFLFMLILPVLQVLLFYNAVGRNPIGLKLAIVSDEIIDYDECFNSSLVTAHAENFECSFNKISCRFLTHFNDSIAEKIYYRDYQTAYYDASKGIVVGIIYFASNFTESLETVNRDREQTLDSIFDHSRIQIFMDRTDQLITFFLDRKIWETYKEYSEKLMSDCQLPIKSGNIPINLMEPIYGSYNSDYTDSMAPGLVLTGLFFFTALSAAIVFINDKSTGIWNRTVIAGISTQQFLTSHVITQIFITFVNLIGCIIAHSIVSDSVQLGSGFLVILLFWLIQCSGLFLGMLISIHSESFVSATFVLNGIVVLCFILCGVAWPIEGMPLALQYFSFVLPFTLPIFAIRSITFKGFTFFNRTILLGFSVPMLWILGLIVLCSIGLKRNRLTSYKM